MKYQSETIGAVMLDLNNEYFLPSIQRPYVWETGNIIRLFDSIMGDYPIGSFLFWRLESKNMGDWEIYKFISFFQQGNIHNDLANLPDGKAATLVLDGQQRLTSLCIGLMGNYKIKKKGMRRTSNNAWVTKGLYLNLLKNPNAFKDENASDENSYEFNFFDIYHPPQKSDSAFWFKVSDMFVLREEREYHAFYIEMSTMLSQYGEQLKTIGLSNLNRLREVVWKEDFISYYTERNQSYDKVLDIFIRANDGGTKLSKSDLLMSMITLKWEKISARNATENLLNELRKIANPKKSMEREFLLRSSLYISDLEFGFQVKNFTPNNINAIEKGWLRIQAALIFTATMFRSFGIHGMNLPAINPIMLVAYYVEKVNRDRLEGDFKISIEDQERIRRWVASAFVQKILGFHTGTTFGTFRRMIKDEIYIQDDFPAKKLCDALGKRGRSMLYDDESIEKLMDEKATGSFGFLALSLLYDQTYWSNDNSSKVAVFPVDLFHKNNLVNSGYLESVVTDVQDRASKVQNYILLTKDEVLERQSMEFDMWLQTRTPEFFARHLLPDTLSLYEVSDFLGFVEARKALIAEHLKSLFDE